MLTIYTIGHSNHKWETFIALLRQHDVDLLVDVRSKPASRHATFANKNRLPALLTEAEIGHKFMGDTVGGKPADPALQDSDGNPDYGKIAAQDTFQRGVDELAEVTKGRRAAIMCAEEDPAQCHRNLLIGPALRDRDVDLRHIRKDGSVEAALL